MRHHYLSHNHHRAAQVFIATIDNVIAGFISILHFPHPIVRNMKKVHRLVILPEFQGLSIGIRLVDFIAEMYINNRYRFTIKTSHPALINSLSRTDKWICRNHGRMGKHTGLIAMNSSSSSRITASFERIL